MVNTFFIAIKPKVTAKILDDKRLGKQRVEALQILNVLLGKTSAWKHHPAVLAWQGYETGLMAYYNAMVKEWCKRGKKNTMELFELDEEPEYPPWCSNKKIHHSHMARLIQKEPSHYAKLLSPPEECLKYGYIWPSKWTNKQLLTLPIDVLSEPYKDEVYCDEIKSNGKKCTYKASFGNKCGIHREDDFVIKICQAKYKNGKKCVYKARPDSDYCGVHRDAA